MKKALKITGITLLSLIVLAFLIPVVFKKQVQALVKREINKNLNAKVDFTDVKISLFKHFPRVTVSIKGLSIVGKDIFSKDTLVSAEKTEMTAGLFSVLKGKNIKVHGLYLQSPRIHILVKKNGLANYDIAKKSSDTSSSNDTSASNFKMTLQRYSLNNAYLVYDDQQANTYTEIKGLQHAGSGDLTADAFTLSTNTKAESAYFVQDDIPYLLNTKADIETDIKIDNKTQTYTFKTDDINLNALKLSAEGFIQMINNKTFKMDVKFKSPTNDFKDILSMIPAIYKKDFDKIKTSGEVVFNGFAKGTLSPTEIPAYDVNLQIKNGSFQYPDLPKPVKNIQLTLHAVNVDGQPDNSVIDIPKGHLEMDNEPFDFNFTYKNPSTIQYIDAGAKGKLDLSQVSKFIKLEAGTKLSGIVWADAFIKGPMKAIQTQTGNFTAGGFFDIKNLYYADKAFPQPIQNGNMKATLTNAGGVADNTSIDISTGHIEVGKDPVDFTLRLRNPVSSVDFSGHAKGRFTLDHIKQFIALAPGEAISGQLNTDLDFAGSNAALRNGEYDKILLNGNAGLANISYKSNDYPTGIGVPATQLVFNQKTVNVNGLSGKYLATSFTANGTMNNLVGYAMEGQPLTGNLTATADYMDLNQWMGTTASATPAATSTTATNTAATTSAAKAFLVPAAINFIVNANVDKVKYDKVEYLKVSGIMAMADEKIDLKNINAYALDGSAVINGSYSTRINKAKPDISLGYEIKGINIQKAFLAYNTVESLMPIGKFLSGKLSSQLSLVGNLDGKMIPLVNSLTGKGNLLLLEGVLAKFAPLEKIASTLQIDKLKSISMKDVKNYFEFSNGKVMIKPFNVIVNDIEMEIGGIHGFDQVIDYAVKMKLPRSVMGSKGVSLVDGLIAKAKSKGIPVSASETVNLSLRITGTMSNPEITVNLKEMAADVIKDIEKQAIDFAKDKLDSAKKKTLDSLNVVKKQAEDKLKEKLADKGIDTTNLSVKNVKDTLKQRITDSLKKKLKEKLFGH